jgi:hypothetical protein
VVVVVDVDVDVEVEVDVLVDVLVVVGVVVLVVDVVVVVCRIDAGLLPATTTAAVNPPNASSTHATTADLNVRMGKTPFLVVVCNRRVGGYLQCVDDEPFLNAVSFGERKGTSRISSLYARSVKWPRLQRS